MAVIYGPLSNDVLLHCLGLFVMSVPVLPHEPNLKGSCSPPMSIHRGTFKPNRGSYRVGEKVLYQCDSSIVYRFGDGHLECEGNEKWKGRVPYCAFPEDINSVYHDNGNKEELIDRNEDNCASSGLRDSWHIHTKENLSGHVVIKIIARDLSSGSSANNYLLQAKNNEESCSRGEIVTTGRKGVLQYNFDCEVREKMSHFEIVPTSHYNYQIKLCEIYIYRKKSSSCSSRVKIQNGGVVSPKDASRVGYSESIIFSCDEGYRLEGRSYLRCNDGIFDSPPPNCKPVSCTNAPPTVMNGKWHEWNASSHYIYGNYLVASCESGHAINNGINFTQCQKDGSWSGKDVACFKEEVAASLLVPIVATVMTFVIVVVVVIVTYILCSKTRNTEKSKSRNSEHIYNEPMYYSSVVQQPKLSPPNPPLKTHPIYSDPLDNYYSLDNEGCYYEPCSLRKDDEDKDVFQNVNKNNPVYSGEDEGIEDGFVNEQRNLRENIPKNDISVENELYGSD